MAAGECTDGKLSEEIMDFTCTPCRAKDRNKQAIKFCETCNKFYCTSCLSHHDEIFADHDQLDPEEFANQEEPALLLPTQRCGRHKNELLQMYCQDHDVVVCNTCVTMQHRSCSEVLHIPAKVQTLLEAITKETIKTGLRAIVSMLEKDKQSVDASLNKLRDKRNSILESIEKHGQTLKALIDDLVEKSKREVHKQYQILEEEFQKKVTAIEEDKAELDTVAMQMDHVEKQKNDAQLFVTLKRSQPRMAQSQKLHSEIVSWIMTTDIKYVLNQEIKKQLKKFRQIGSFIVKDTKPSLYSVKGETKVRVCQDRMQCHITSCCQLLDDHFLATDYSCKKIVRLDISCDKITDQCPVPGIPYAVCLIDDTEAAVSLLHSQTIQFVSLGPKMALTRSVKLQHKTRGLAFSLGELFITDGDNKVYVHDTIGKHLRTLENITPERQKFATNVGTDHLHVSSDGQKVYVSHRDVGVVCVDRNGKQLFTFGDSQMSYMFTFADSQMPYKYTHGIHTNDYGHAFVCGKNSNNVIQLSEDGKKLGVLNGINEPASQYVCFDSKKRRLLVTKEKDSFISSYELE